MFWCEEWTTVKVKQFKNDGMSVKLCYIAVIVRKYKLLLLFLYRKGTNDVCSTHIRWKKYTKYFYVKSSLT